MSILFGFRLDGLAALISSLNGASGKLDEEIAKRMSVLVLEVAGTAQRFIQGTRATNPPELLGIRTGRLRASITGVVKRTSKGLVEGIITPQGVKYAAVHELGSALIGHPEMHIPARPYLARALKEKEPRILELLGGAFSAAVTR